MPSIEAGGWEARGEGAQAARETRAKWMDTRRRTDSGMNRVSGWRGVARQCGAYNSVPRSPGVMEQLVVELLRLLRVIAEAQVGARTTELARRIGWDLDAVVGSRAR